MPNTSLWRYAGLATQFFFAIGIAVFAGIKLDKILLFSMPVLVWVLPLAIIVILMIKIIRDTSTKK